MDNKEIQDLFLKYREGTCSEAEIALIENWIISGEFAEREITDVEIENELRAVSIGLPLVKSVKFWPRFAAAASIILCIGFGSYYLMHKQPPQTAYYKNDVPPGHMQATLTLANGQRILLTKGLYRALVQGSTGIQINNGVIYTANPADKTEKITYNTLSTSTGEESPYPLILPDGSKVWLNAQSSITFPIKFKGKERIVKITGEALFEVKHNLALPFKVETYGQTIRDIGTTFNVNAYKDELSIKTTLVEGTLKVNNLILKPNEQTDGIHIRTVDAESYTAWKDGNFHFEGDNIQTIMRQLARWYNIKITYQGKITHEVFYADISRSHNISAILKVLKNSKVVNFKIEGRRIIVME